MAKLDLPRVTIYKPLSNAQREKVLAIFKNHSANRDLVLTDRDYTDIGDALAHAESTWSYFRNEAPQHQDAIQFAKKLSRRALALRDLCLSAPEQGRERAEALVWQNIEYRLQLHKCVTDLATDARQAIDRIEERHRSERSYPVPGRALAGTNISHIFELLERM